MSINEALFKGVSKIRKPNWSNPMDHLELTILPPKSRMNPSEDKVLGPWGRLWSPINKPVLGFEDPKMVLLITFDLDERAYEKFELKYDPTFPARSKDP
jgi:hypothetical protein